MTVLQTKLYQAAKQAPQRRFHALYDRLSVPYVLQAAWEAVRQNRGAAGVDQQTLADLEAQGVPEFLTALGQTLRERTYRPQPVRRVAIPKPDGKTRPLGIPTVRDRVVQAALKLLLEPIFEADFEGLPSFGFRPGLGPQDALAAIQTHAQAGFAWVVDADVEQFFDTLDHQQLLTALRRRISDGEVLRLIYRFLKAGYLLDGKYYDTDQGSPQGGVLSPLLANVYLYAFDQAQRDQQTFLGHLVRYADDFVLQCGTALQAERALAWAQAQLQTLGLRLHPTKTRVVADREGFDFLGFHHHRGPRRRSGGRGGGRLHRWPSPAACRRFREQLRELVGPPGRLRTHWGATLRGVARYLTGWVQYYRHGQSTATFQQLDQYVAERVARNRARAEPSGRKRRRRTWQECLARLREWGQLPRLTQLAAGPFGERERVKVRWRAG